MPAATWREGSLIGRTLVVLLTTGCLAGAGRPVGGSDCPHGAASSASASSVGCSWAEGFHLTDLDYLVHALVVHDDGSGPALYAGGSFSRANGVEVNSVARWDGVTWSALEGPAGVGTSSEVYALASFDDGSGPALYAGGRFEDAGGVAVASIARWDGAGWSALSGPVVAGVDGRVRCLAAYDDGDGPALYAGGAFLSAGGATVHNVARWDGSGWSPLTGPAGIGTDEEVRAFAVYDDGTGEALYAAGDFTVAGGLWVAGIARWDGIGWARLSGPAGTGIGPSPGYTSVAYALETHDDGTGEALYVGGYFSTAGGVSVANLARWDGARWSALPGGGANGPDSSVLTLASLDVGGAEELYAAGLFETVGGATANHVARWDGAVWSDLPGPAGIGTDDLVRALVTFDDGSGPALYGAGSFTSAGGLVTNRVARWQGTWTAVSPVAGGGTSGGVGTFAAHDDGSGLALYAGGWFAAVGDAWSNNVARWDGVSWSPLVGPSGIGVDGWVEALVSFSEVGSPALFAGGGFTTAGGVTVNNLARWDGTGWSAVVGPSGSGTSSMVHAQAVHDDGGGAALYVGGQFLTAGGVTVSGVARWDGNVWSALAGPAGTGVSGSVSTLASYDDGSGPELYAGGEFVEAGGVTVNGIARWDGSGWWPLVGPGGVGVDDRVDALAVFDDGSGLALYVAGSFTTAGGIPANNIARWNETGWTAVPGTQGPGTHIWSLAVYDDGDRACLHAGGDFTEIGGVAAANIARWDGVTWSALEGPAGDGIGGRVNALGTHDDGSGPALYAGGSFSVAGGLGASNIARWGCGLVFVDRFEGGDTSRWAVSVP